MHRNLVLTACATSVVVLLACAFASCKSSGPAKVAGTGEHSTDLHTDTTTFLDVTNDAGITWKHVCGQDGRKFFPEYHCSGAAFIDYDNDGWLDILLLQGRHWPLNRPSAESTMVLYHNNHDGTFTDVTKKCGLDIPMMSMGVTVGDYDNDGWNDLYITNLGENYLFHNDHGVFRNVTNAANVGGGPGHWSTSAMWIDYDNDGFLDLYVCNYVRWSEETDIFCTVNGAEKTNCGPTYYPGDFCVMYHNDHDGTFTDVSTKTGVHDAPEKALGVVMMDYDNDGWTDMFVSNDKAPNRLFHNDHGVFKDVGVEAGIAYDEGGTARSGMGIDWADVDRDGKPTVMIGNFTGEMDWVYKYAGNGSFVDRAPQNGIGTVSLPYLTFGTVMFDYDYDGWPDMACVNGHVQPEIEIIQHTTTTHQQSLLFRNQANGSFEEVGLKYMQGPFARWIIGRSLAYGDFNNDGNIDLLAQRWDDYPLLMKCVRKNSNHYLRVKLHGMKSNRNGYGARIRATVGSMTMHEMMKSGASFQSANEPVVSLGLGQAKKVDQLIVQWNCGTVDTLRDIAGDRMVEIIEGSNAAETVVPQP